MAELDFMSVLHKSTTRDYLARVNDPDFPKAKAADLATQWGYDYWDGDRRINYGGYRYMEGRWEKVARAMAEHYELPSKPKILDIGCGKGFLLYDFLKVIPDAEIYGLDISSYALENCKEEIKGNLRLGNATDLPWEDNTFDLVFSINTFHNLHAYDLDRALREMERVGKSNKYICVESYRNQAEKTNLLYWQVTCEAFCTPKEWLWWFENCGYAGDHSFIYFE
jgi:protein-L-isoaspartate(D-aspartate) O-methyltransferase